MNNKFFAVTMASIMSLNVFPVNVFRKTVQAEITFKSNVSKIAGPEDGTGKESTWNSETQKYEGPSWKGNYVYFGRYPQTLKEGANSSSTNPNDFEIEPIKWRVLDPSNTAWDDSSSIEDNGFAYNTGYYNNEGGRQNAPVGGPGMLLYSDKNIDGKQYHPTYNSGNEVNELCWGGNGGGSGKGCTLWAWLNGYDNTNVLKKSDTEYSAIPENSFIEEAFSDEELAAIIPTKVYSEDLYNERGIDPIYKYSTSTRTSLTKDKIFLPSYNEILNSSYGFTSTYDVSNTRSFGFSNYSNNLKDDVHSWLRSPGNFTNSATAANLESGGNVDDGDHVDNTYAVCPAFNLNLTSVIFASEAAESGASDTEGGGKKSMEVSSIPASFELPTGTGNEYKLTLHDESRDDFVAEKIAQNGNEITISYSNAKTGENEYISCMILDDDSEIKYYGKLKEVDSESGEATLTLPEEFEIGDTVNVVVFNEQCNEGNETDWSNWPSVFEVTVEKATEPEKDSSDESENDFNFSFSYLEPSRNSQKTEVNESESKIIFTAYSEKESVEIFNGDTKEVKYEDKVANITPKLSDNILEIEIKDENGNELNVGGKIILIAPQDICKPGTVAVTSNGKVVRKSIAKDGKLYLPLKSSETYKIFDNKKIFFDVSNHWANDAIDFASGYELFNGTASNIFEPETPMSRAMMVQVLHNLEDNPYQTFEKIFDDVNFDNWFAEAVTWASKNNFVLGYDDKNFGSNDNITREQLATILYRYFGENEVVDIDLNFVDADQISDYALKTMKWAVKYGIIQGKGNNILDPKGLATRAEVAQMFQNLMLNLFY